MRILEALGTHRGVRQVREALHLACVMSGSPRETKLSLRLALPPALGGYGLNVLSMNEPVEVRRIRDRMQTGIRKPDILIGGPITEGRRVVAAVEYNGRVHDEPAQLASDADRTNELTRMGIPEFIVRREQYRDLDYMDGLAAGIRERLGLPEPRPSSARTRELRRRRFELYRELELIDGVQIPSSSGPSAAPNRNSRGFRRRRRHQTGTRRENGAGIGPQPELDTGLERGRGNAKTP